MSTLNTTRLTTGRSRRGALSAAALALCLMSGCTLVPSDGPKAAAVFDAAAPGKAARYGVARPLVFDVVEVDSEVANIVSAYRPQRLAHTFGFGGSAGTPVIGVGDRLQITIFEAGPDGLFSSSQSRSTSFEIVVQPDGRASIPYVGQVRFAGRTQETVRASITQALEGKAVEPDVLLSLVENGSRSVSINGKVNSPSVVPLPLDGAQILEAVALAGGPSEAPFDTTVSLSRAGRVAEISLQTIIENPTENIYLKPNDQIFVSHDPQTFTALGSTGRAGRIPFETGSLSLIEAAALAGGGNAEYADARGYFVFRYEPRELLVEVIGIDRFNELVAQGMKVDRTGNYPMVYRLDLEQPQSFIIGQNFPVRNKDVIFLARHPSSDFIKFLNLITRPIAVGGSVAAL